MIDVNPDSHRHYLANIDRELAASMPKRPRRRGQRGAVQTVTPAVLLVSLATGLVLMSVIGSTVFI